jgi:sigma-E factor negative regulatory protein RseA
MHDEINQKISQLLDDELTQADALSLLKKMQLQPKLQDKLNRYEAISHTLKTEVFLMPDIDFAARVSEQIQNEPSYLIPQRQRFQYGYKMLALAASVAAIALIASWDMVHQDIAQPFKVDTVAQTSAQQSSANTNVLAKQTQSEQVPLNARINDYLQAHNNSVYTNGEASFKPYARVAAYNRE